jgi:Amt family ammonium transporter
MKDLNPGDTAWLLVSTALVLLMTPALALFYGGMVRRKNVLSTLMHSMTALPVISVQWALVGYSLAFGATRGGWIGGWDYVGMRDVTTSMVGTVPRLSHVSFQMMFAVITPALISGAFAERMKYSAYVAFIVLWSTLVYDPVAHWVWAEGGWLLKLGALDFAGGTVVHATAGVSALVCALVIGKRLKYPQERPLPHNLTMTLTGAGILWFGWFGFNAGSAVGTEAVPTTAIASLAFLTTHLGAAGGALGWLLVEWRHRGKPTALGVASGLVAGLVAITPAAGYVAPWAAILIGIAASLACYAAVLAKYKYGYDDSLDAFGVHGVGGLAGALLTGVFAQKTLGAFGENGLFFGNPRQAWLQLVACAASAAYAGVMTWGILKLIDKVIGLRVTVSDEREGLDTTQHGEEGYAG